MFFNLSLMLIANWEFSADVDHYPPDVLLSYKRMMCKCVDPLSIAALLRVMIARLCILPPCLM